MFVSSGPSGGTSIDEAAGYVMAKNAENGFIQRTILNQRYGVNCNKLTLWEYMLLIEHTHKQDK
jgi:hypothetical protein